MNTNKKTGTYYTPQKLADFVVFRLFGFYPDSENNTYAFPDKIDVLEPSAGDGIFVNALFANGQFADKIPMMPSINLSAVEIDPSVATQLDARSEQFREKGNSITVHTSDYLKYALEDDKKYDLIIGNPPYIRARNMDQAEQELCSKVHELSGFSDKSPKNIWTAFLAAAVNSLKENGVIAFVLPTDLLQVLYAEEIRNMLKEKYDKVERFTLNWLYFDDIEQDVVVLLCGNGHGKKQAHYHIESEEDLLRPTIVEDHDNLPRASLNKWTNYLLSNNDLAFIDNVIAMVEPKVINDYCSSAAGTVTAANDFYIVSKDVIDKYGLSALAKPMIRKSTAMPPALILTSEDIQRKIDSGTPLCFVDLPNAPVKDLSENYRRYIMLGESTGLNQRYKMQKRAPWYVVPSVWTTNAFFTKRSNIYPRVIVNDANAYVTDSFYRITMHDGYSISNFAFSFYNTLTMIYAELEGRYYGGSVLELTPNEFKRLPVPYLEAINNSDIEHLDKMMRDKRSIKDILAFTDTVILRDGYGISEEEVQNLTIIYQRLLLRRMKGKITGTGYVA